MKVALICLLLCASALAMNIEELNTRVRARQSMRETLSEEEFLDHTLMERVREHVVAQGGAKTAPTAFVFVDAGSSGSRPNIFSVSGSTVTHCGACSKIDRLTELKGVNKAGTETKAESFINKIKTDCAAFSHNAKSKCAGDKAKFSADGTAWVSTVPIVIQATAGMRILSDADRNEITDALVAKGAQTAATTTGRWEGMYGFYRSYQYFKGVPASALATSNFNNVVYIEIGGASVQVAFTTAFASAAAGAAAIGRAKGAFLELESGVEGPMKLGLLPADIREIYSKSFLGNAQDRMHAHAIKKCATATGAFAGSAKEANCACLPKGSTLLRSTVLKTYPSGKESACAKDAETKVKYCLERIDATTPTDLDGAKDYDKPVGFLDALGDDKSLKGTGKFDDCYNIVKGIHDNDDDEVPGGASKYSAQWDNLKNFLGIANRANAKTHVILNTPLVYSPLFSGSGACKLKDDGTLTLGGSTDTFEKCIEAMNEREFSTDGGRSYKFTTTHALVKDILTRLSLWGNGKTFHMITPKDDLNSWLPAAAQLYTEAAGLSDTTTKGKYITNLQKFSGASIADEDAPFEA